jgi:outer membrane lipoprotein carrier protein
LWQNLAGPGRDRFRRKEGDMVSVAFDIILAQETMMHFFSRFVMATTLLFLPVISPAAGGPPVAVKDVIATLEQGYATLSDLQADFSQRTTIASMNREERGTGEIFIKKSSGGAMFRFNYKKPRQQIISNGKTVWYWLPENHQVLISDTATLFEGGNGVALNYLTGLGHISADFTASFAAEPRDKKGDYVLDLVPKKATPVMAKLRLTVSTGAVDDFVTGKRPGKPFPVVSSVVFDQLGNRTRIDFSNIRTNRGLGSDRFTFKVPAGVEVIKQ